MLLLVVFAGVFLRCHQISYNFDGDEIFSVDAARSDISKTLSILIADRVHPPVHNVALHYWGAVVGFSEAGMRSLSVLASTGFLIIMFRVAMLLLRPMYAFYVAMLCACSPLLVIYGQQARPYALALFFAATSFYILVRQGFESPGWKWPVRYGICCALLVNTMYASVFLITAEVLGILCWRSANRFRLILAAFLGAATIAPWLLIIGSSMHGVDNQMAWIPKPRIFDVLYLYVQFFGSVPHASMTLVLLFAVIAALIVKNHRRLDIRLVVTVATLAFLPPVVVYLVSWYGPLSIWAVRQLLFSGPMIFLLIGLAIECVPRRLVLVPATALVLWCLSALPEAIPAQVTPPWRELAQRFGGSEYTVITNESFVAKPLTFYMEGSANVIDISEARELNDQRVIYVCRPVRCDTSAIQGFRIEHEESIRWNRTANSPTNMLQVYSLVGMD
ncbi:MAG TPA: glycosyltransferase family 39 protein [Terriglobales bacterium]|nr:glycosyltransferase family 39 protein [Terriglobales bacterium]